MKTYKKWKKSNVDLDKFLSPGDLIDYNLLNYIAEVVPVTYISAEFIQGGDAIKSEDNVFFYMTINCVAKHKYLYLGILPEFKQ